jgi:hypothetical protein
LGSRIALVVGQRVGEGGGGTVGRLRVAIEPAQHIVRRRAAQSRQRRKGRSSREREQDDARDAQEARRELPGAEPRSGKE